MLFSSCVEFLKALPYIWNLQSSWYTIVTSFPYSLVVCKLKAFLYWPELPTASQENIERVPPIGRHLQSLYKKTFVQYKKNETPNKKELTPEARAILAANMTLEYEFYQFVKERLRLQKRSIGLMGKFMRNFIHSQTLIWTQNAISFQHFWVLKNPVCQIEKTAIWKDAQNSLDWRKLTAFQNAAFDFPRVFSQKKQWTILCRKLWFWCRTFLLSFKN